jgi:hypothetical protein
MPTWAWILILVGAALVLVLLVAGLARRRSGRLRGKFGPEYDRTVERSGGRRAAEAELEGREAKRQRLRIERLTPEARERYLREWGELQQGFVDQPSRSLLDADRVVTEVMRERGYPMDDFEQRAADISVDHPQVVEHYRAAHRIYAADERGDATTEELRQAVVHYRALFEELVEKNDEAEADEAEVRSGGRAAEPEPRR